jgi:ankyrin repeat protein
LIEVAEAGDIDQLTMLLAKGCDVNHVDSYRGGYTALHIAAQNGHKAAVRVLIENGANVNARDGTGCTVLRSAAICHGGWPQIVHLLLRSGANAALADRDGRTPLDWATLNDPKDQNAEVVARLRAARR